MTEVGHAFTGTEESSIAGFTVQERAEVKKKVWLSHSICG